MICGEDILRLIPQRNPFIMVDEFEARDDKTAITALTVRPDNLFTLTDGTLSVTGLIEHVAQSCSALAGWLQRDASVEGPPVGLIGEVKHFQSHRPVRTGEKVSTTITFVLSFGNVTVAQGVCTVGDEVVAEGQLKVFMQG